jgi:hypothetical protein
VTLPSKEVFFAQARLYSSQNPNLRADYFREWLKIDTPTIPMWGNDKKREVYWANPLKCLLRTGGLVRTRGIGPRENVTFDKDEDLRILNRDSRGEFVRRLRELSAVWFHMDKNQDNSEFPAKFANAIEDPEILRCFPVNTRLIGLLRSYGTKTRPDIKDVLRVVRGSLGSLDGAARKLLRMYDIPEGEREFLRQVTAKLQAWRQRIPTGKSRITAKTLWAFDQLLSIVGYCQQGDLKFPAAFSSDSTYPIGKLVGLLPASLLTEPLLAILASDNDYNVLQHAAWCIGIINHPSGSNVWCEVREQREWLRKSQKRKSEIGENWALVDRQLLYAGVQLGDAEVSYEYIERFKKDGVGQFEAVYNHLYYGGDQDLIKDRFERRLDEGGLRTDQNVFELLPLHLQQPQAVDTAPEEQ